MAKKKKNNKRKRDAEQTIAQAEEAGELHREPSQPPNALPLTEKCLHYTHVSEVPWDIQRYWQQRHSIFSRYDEGIHMTDDAWFGVTPEPVAQQVAYDIASTAESKDTIIDLFAGAGGNTIAFALSGHFKHVIAIEKDPDTIACAQHNAQIYGVYEQITWVNDDSFTWIPSHTQAQSQGTHEARDETERQPESHVTQSNLRAMIKDVKKLEGRLAGMQEMSRFSTGPTFIKQLQDIIEKVEAELQLKKSELAEAQRLAGAKENSVKEITFDPQRTILFASPPWGGPGYRTDTVFNLANMQPYNLGSIYSLCQHVGTSPCALYLPRTSDLRQIAKLAPEGKKIDVVQYCMQGASKALVAYIPGAEESDPMEI